VSTCILSHTHTLINHSELTDAAVAEIEQFKAALRKYYASKDCEMMLFDRCIGTRGAFHMHLQVSDCAHTIVISICSARYCM
jgi:Protein similar to CwfJ C-terminus 1